MFSCAHKRTETKRERGHNTNITTVCVQREVGEERGRFSHGHTRAERIREKTTGTKKKPTPRPTMTSGGDAGVESHVHNNHKNNKGHRALTKCGAHGTKGKHSRTAPSTATPAPMDADVVVIDSEESDLSAPPSKITMVVTQTHTQVVTQTHTQAPCAGVCGGAPESESGLRASPSDTIMVVTTQAHPHPSAGVCEGEGGLSGGEAGHNGAVMARPSKRQGQGGLRHG